MKPQIVHDYKPFAFPRKGLFRVHHPVNQYTSEGWKQQLQEAIIIGEDDTCYITHLKESHHGEWVDNKVVQHWYLVPMGIHKSRLVRWTEGQITLF